MTVIALGALHVLDTADGMRHRRFLPAALVVDHTAGRPGHRGAGVVAFRRRQHLRRRLHPDDGPGVRARRLHGQLLPLVRHARRRRSAGTTTCWRCGRTSAPTASWVRLPTLVMALACWWVISREVIPRLGHAVKTQPRRGVDGGGHVPGVLAAAEQRPAPRTDHRAGHPADLVLGRARRSPPAGCCRWRSRSSSAR